MSPAAFKLLFFPAGATAPDTYASALLNLQRESCSKPPTAISETECRGSDLYYEKMAAEVVDYALSDPEECQRFLATVFLPSTERMGLTRKKLLLDRLASR